ncbi:hypothetical protein LCGC14_0813650 [marine sediment metagenome]|uniref:Uncharacterized protein n=1 Tax=marine sediment metagenome TaxID=412755 RepID=A0A0F9STD0_9ZZZZ
MIAIEVNCSGEDRRFVSQFTLEQDEEHNPMLRLTTTKVRDEAMRFVEGKWPGRIMRLLTQLLHGCVLQHGENPPVLVHGFKGVDV